MAERGGYRAPANPAPVSGPGALSQRTDVQSPMPLPNPAYGEQQEFMALQGAAPMAMEPTGPMPTPLTAPTDRPDEPLTAGSPMGDGPGMEMLTRDQQRKEIEGLGRYLPMMERMAGRVDAPRSFRALVQFIRASSPSGPMG